MMRDRLKRMTYDSYVLYYLERLVRAYGPRLVLRHRRKLEVLYTPHGLELLARRYYALRESDLSAEDFKR